MDSDRFVLISIALMGGALLYLAYRAALPRPIPGIAYHKSAANSLFGDIPSMLRHLTTDKAITNWFHLQCAELNSPIMQLFIRPLGRPMVFLADWRETQDILTRRKEFDRYNFFAEVFRGLLPNAFLIMQTNDTFWHQRRLVASTMSPSFLAQVSAPRIYDTVLDLVKLWHMKIELAGYHPFSASSDIHHVALDAIWAAAFGTLSGTTRSQVSLLSSLAKLEALSLDENVPAEFPKARTPATFNAIVTMTDSLADLIGSPLPSWHHWFIRQTSSYRTAKKYKDSLFDQHFRNARKEYSDNLSDQKTVSSALESMLQREAIAATKEGRIPRFDSPVARDELFTFLIAGHETTSTAVTWALKHLSDIPEVQQRLRAALVAQFPNAAAAGTNPSAEDIAKYEIPYLDAVIEEVLRCSSPSNGAVRIAKEDTDVLGYHIPAGTDVYMLANGPSFMSPGFKIDESQRSPSSQANKNNSGGQWDTKDMGAFKPDRWLSRDEKGAEVYNPQAGPQLAFGLGPRGCFGKKLAYVELRIIMVLIVWHFELKKSPPELSGYEAVDTLTHKPLQCFVRLGLAPGSSSAGLD